MAAKRRRLSKSGSPLARPTGIEIFARRHVQLSHETATSRSACCAN
jgi:hypothetical protein